MDAGFVRVAIAITGVTMVGIYLSGRTFNQVGQLGDVGGDAPSFGADVFSQPVDALGAKPVLLAGNLHAPAVWGATLAAEENIEAVDINVLINTVTSAENGGIVVFASSTGRQLSAESSEWGNGAFTKAIVEGIQLGKADLLGDGFITTSSLGTFVEHRVRVLNEDRQNPVMGRPPDEPDFAIAQVSK